MDVHMDIKLRSRDWAGLSDLALDLILQKLPSISDYVRFSVVCKSWFSFVSNNYNSLQQRINPSELPLLMIFRYHDSWITNSSLYSITKDKILLDFKLPLHGVAIYCGSSHGWLVYEWNIKNHINQIDLFNPFTGEIINLPCSTFYAFKVILSKNPSTNPNTFEVVVLVAGICAEYKLAILKPGSKTWIFTCFQLIYGVCDMIDHGGKCYIVNNKGGVSSIDKTTSKYDNLANLDSNLCDSGKFYLVKTTTDELLRVEIRRKPFSVKISKLVTNPTTQKSIFVDVDNLGEEALFLCECGSMSVLASKFLGCKSNSIYYIDSGYHSLSSCDLQDGSVRTLISFNEAHTIPPASFIIPTPKFTT